MDVAPPPTNLIEFNSKATQCCTLYPIVLMPKFKLQRLPVFILDQTLLFCLFLLVKAPHGLPPLATTVAED